MDVVYRLGLASAADIHAALPDAPTYTSVRGLLRILVEKQHLLYDLDGRRYMYRAATSRPTAGASSMSHVVKTFFAGSAADAMAALLGSEKDGISDAELARLSELVQHARRSRKER